MAYNRQYQAGVGWQNEPSVATPINASNLNQMDNAILAVDTEAARAIGVHDDSIYDLYDRLEDKQDTLVFDSHPILGSSKPVTSDGIFRAIQQSGGSGGDVTLDSVYLIGYDNMPSSISPNLTIDTVNRTFDKDTKQYIMFRFGTMAEASGWPSNYDITLNVNSTGDFIVKKNHVKLTTDNWTIKKDVVYMACANSVAGIGSTSYFWDLFEIPYDASGTYDILPIAHGGTGNALGYIRTGQKANTTAGTAATAEGSDNTISGNYSHAEGQLNSATGNYTHAGGYYNTAGYPYQTVIGRFNENKMTTLFEVGRGTGVTDRKNAFEVYSTGDVTIDGQLYVGSTIYDMNHNAISAVEANPSGTATTPLSKLKVGTTVFSVSGMPADPLPIANGGTGNTVGYIQTGRKENTTVGTNATIEGANNTVSGTNGYAGGLENISRYDNQTVIGKYNNNKNSLFEIGNGTSTSARSNAFEVYANGNATVQGTLTASSVSASSNISASGNVSATNITATGTVSDANGALNATVANPTGVIDGGRLQYIKIGATSYTVGDGTLIMSKKRYQIYSSSWSSSQSGGYYTYNLSLSTPQLNTSYPPNVYISGSGDTTEPTDTQKSMYALLVKCNLSTTNRLVLYAKVKPTSSFYIYVEGVSS